MDGPSLNCLDGDLVLEVDVFEALELLVDVPEHLFVVLVAEGVAVGEEDLGGFGEGEVEVQFCVIFLGLSP